MAAYVNMAAIGATAFRSDALGPLDSVAHPLAAGNYRGEVWQGESRLGSFLLEVTEKGDGEQIEVDLCAVGPRSAATTQAYRSGPMQGQPVYAVFHCDQGAMGLHVILRDQAGRGVQFDSRALQAGDYYILTPVRPGAWAMETGKTGRGRILVKDPKPGRKPRASAAGAMVKVTEKGFSPDNVEIVAGDGVAFEIGAKDAVVQVKLAEQPATFTKGRRAVGIRLAGRSSGASPAAGGRKGAA